MEDVSGSMDEYVAICQDCDWEQSMPGRDMAEHAKRVHESEYDHNVILDS